MSREWMLQTLTTLGFTETDAQVYIYLTTQGFQRAKDIANALKLYKRKLYRSLKNLQAKGIINVSSERPARFSAVPFDRVLDVLMEVKKEQQRMLHESREELLSTWQFITKKDAAPKS